MARLTLDFPEDQYYYATQLTVRVTDINGANHLGNDSMISMISEARARFLFDFGLEDTLGQDVGTIVTDLATTYRNELKPMPQVLDKLWQAAWCMHSLFNLSSSPSETCGERLPASAPPCASCN